MDLIEKPLVNRVANSGLITLKPEEWWPTQPLVELDIAPFLFKGLLLKEVEFRQHIKDIPWHEYQDVILCVHCSTDAIIPLWAYMLVGASARPFVFEFFAGNSDDYIKRHYAAVIRALDVSAYMGKKVVVKGCGDRDLPQTVYADLGFRLSGVVQSLMFGEACSTVPIYKKK
jgi:hypothetical protein